MDDVDVRTEKTSPSDARIAAEEQGVKNTLSYESHHHFHSGWTKAIFIAFPAVLIVYFAIYAYLVWGGYFELSHMPFSSPHRGIFDWLYPWTL